MRMLPGFLVFTSLVGVTVLTAPMEVDAAPLQIAIGEADITPSLEGEKPVWLAGYLHGRAATGVHDPLYARALLLSDGQTTIALVSLDLIGWSYPSTKRIRERLPELDYVMVASTHNHEGPDTIGIWGESPLKRGVDDVYNARVESEVVQLVSGLTANLQPVTAEMGMIDRPDLVNDSRLPIVVDATIRTIRFRSVADGKAVGLLVQGTAHPEALGAKNKLITADFPYYVQNHLRANQGCPTVYVSGAIGGLLAPPPRGISAADGTPLELGTFAYAEAFGHQVADAVLESLQAARPVPMTPLRVYRREVAFPIDNPLYRLARSLNVIQREGYEWLGTPDRWGKQVSRDFRPQRGAGVTEVSLLQFGELHVIGIPGELYPELITGEIPDPPEPNVDYPEAPVEPHVEKLMEGRPWLLVGLANDEIGYIIPQRQWDSQPPYAYGRSVPQYGEINSCSHEIAPIIMHTLARLCREAATAK